MIFEMSRQMLREYDGDLGYRKNLMRAFTHFPRHIGLNNRLPAPQPDFIEGLEVRAFGPFLRADDISGAMLYEDDAFSVTLPHLAGEWERDEGGMDKAIQQSAYVGAALVYARNQALSLIGNPDPPGHAVVRTFATNGNHIIFFAHFAAPSEKTGTTEYHQYRYASVDILDDYQGHKEGRQGLRNMQDYARYQSYVLKDQLWDCWQQNRGRAAERAPHPPPEDVPIPSVEHNSEPDGDVEAEEMPPPTKSRPRGRPRKKAARARRGAVAARNKSAGMPSRAPAPPRRPTGERRRSTRLLTIKTAGMPSNVGMHPGSSGPPRRSARLAPK